MATSSLFSLLVLLNLLGCCFGETLEGRKANDVIFEHANSTVVRDPGHRIVDAAKIHPEERFPFLVIFNFIPEKFARCTGSLISPNWVISAAHCLGRKKDISVSDCGTRLRGHAKLACQLLPNGDLKITPIGHQRRPEVLVGVSNVFEEYSKTVPYFVDFIIRPRDSYPGGNYGRFGGYDFILIRLDRSVPHLDPVCLPSGKHFPDVGNATIAGYGRYKRPPCEVNGQGPEKFEFCGVDPECQEGTQKHYHAKCEVQFEYGNKVVQECQHTPTPSSYNEGCKHFHAKVGLNFSNSLDEVILLRKTANNGLDVETKCYRENPGSFGWCGTNHKFFPIEKKQAFNVRPDGGWGFCQRSCFLDPKEDVIGVARVKKVHVIDPFFCTAAMRAENRNRGFAKEPKVICVAYNHTHNTKWFLHDADSDEYKEIPESDELNALIGREFGWYITGTGSCSGDSGGPLLKTIPNEDPELSPKLVLIGITSRGTGIRGNCGGLDNPTQFVRIKLFTKWIQYHVDDELCIVSPDSYSNAINPIYDDSHLIEELDPEYPDHSNLLRRLQQLFVKKNKYISA